MHSNAMAHLGYLLLSGNENPSQFLFVLKRSMVEWYGCAGDWICEEETVRSQLRDPPSQADRLGRWSGLEVQQHERVFLKPLPFPRIMRASCSVHFMFVFKKQYRQISFDSWSRPVRVGRRVIDICQSILATSESNDMTRHDCTLFAERFLRN